MTSSYTFGLKVTVWVCTVFIFWLCSVDSKSLANCTKHFLIIFSSAMDTKYYLLFHVTSKAMMCVKLVWAAVCRFCNQSSNFSSSCCLLELCWIMASMQWWMCLADSSTIVFPIHRCFVYVKFQAVSHRNKYIHIGCPSDGSDAIPSKYFKKSHQIISNMSNLQVPKHLSSRQDSTSYQQATLSSLSIFMYILVW